jgi:hypothetical protein
MAKSLTISTHVTPDAQGGQGPQTQRRKMWSTMPVYRPRSGRCAKREFVDGESAGVDAEGDFAKRFERGKLSFTGDVLQV